MLSFQFTRQQVAQPFDAREVFLHFRAERIDNWLRHGLRQDIRGLVLTDALDGHETKPDSGDLIFTEVLQPPA